MTPGACCNLAVTSAASSFGISGFEFASGFGFRISDLVSDWLLDIPGNDLT